MLKVIITDKKNIMGNITLLSESVLEFVKRKIFALEDYIFQARYSLELNGTIVNEELVTEHRGSLLHATAYQAVWSRNLREIFVEAKKTGYKFNHFIDIGSGKGKACFYAQSKDEFNSILGIEFSKPLVDVANKNKTKYHSENTNFIHADASIYLLPNEASLVFMFNPFDRIVLEKFILNNIDHFKKNKSIIAYANDTERMSLTNFGFETIFRNQTRRISLYQLS